jgi:uncharacterized glyoxalase superfamily metalloenzyme YdcJ
VYTTSDELVERLNDLDRIAAERASAVRAVASASTDAAECRDLLAALGLDPHEGVPAPPAPRRAS